MSTYTLISSQVLGSSAASITFSSIPSTYKDLVLRYSVRTNQGAVYDSLVINTNGSGTNFSQTSLVVSNTVQSITDTGDGGVFTYWVNGNNATSNTFSNGELYIPNYTSTSYTPMSNFSVYENNATVDYMGIAAVLRSRNVAINSLTITTGSTQNILTGSSFYLYGI
jgi:hypothetical protein